MRFILSALGTAGDVFPFIGISKALLSRGDQVTLLTCAPFVELAQREGIEVEAILTQPEYEKTLRDPRLWQPNKGFIAAMQGFGLPALEPAFRYVMQHADDNTVVLGSSISFGAGAAAEKRQLQYVSAHLAPAIFRSTINPPRFPGLWMPSRMPTVVKKSTWYLIDKLFYDPTLLPALNGFLTSHGLPPVKRLLENGMHANKTLALFPDWFASPQRDWATGVMLSHFPIYDGAQSADLDADLAAWIGRVGKPILFTQGSGKLAGEPFLKHAIAACDNLQLPGIFLSADVDVPSDLPESFRVERYVPFGSAMPHLRAIVHHGGIGTAAQALQAGVPQLVVPMSHDQHDNSQRLMNLGVAKELNASCVHASALSDALYELLGHSMVGACCNQMVARFEGVDTWHTILSTLDRLLSLPASATTNVSFEAQTSIS